MTLRFLLDTDVLVDVQNRVGATFHSLDERLEADVICSSIICIGELLEGVVWSNDPGAARRRLDSALRTSNLEIVPLTVDCMEHFAYIRGLLRRQGQKLEMGDLLIAATALAHGLTVVTRNRRHFDRVPGLNVTSPGDGGR